jgi:superfamily II DNA or RNA helicase
VVEKIKIDFQKKGGVLTCSKDILKLVREKFSVKNPSFHSRRFAPRLYAITPSGAFQVGLWNEIENYIRSLNIPISIELTDEFKKQFLPKTGIEEISKIDSFNYYDYQEDAIKQFVENGRGISLIATGGGKALCIAGLTKTFLDHYPNYKILIIVPNVSLLNQLYYSFIDEFSINDVTRWGDGKTPDLSQNIIIANNQILIADIDYTLSVVKDFDVIIVDEVHTINEKKNKISKVIHNIKTPFKFGLTGTLPDSMMGAWNVIGKIGPIVYEKNSFELRKQQTITDVEIKVVVCQHIKKPVPTTVFTEPTDAYMFEYDYVMNYTPRNNVIAKIAKKLNGNTLIVVDRLQYISSIHDCLKNCGKKIYIITGNTPTDERTVIQNTMDAEDNIICIAMSKCFSTGISIKNLHYAIFAYMGKGGVKTVQTIGRTVRKHSSKEKAVIFDISDDLNYSVRHLKERLKIYKDQKITYTLTKIKI